MKSLLAVLVVGFLAATFIGCGGEKEEDCQPSCQGLCGGSDGCGGSCPNTCPGGQSCVAPAFNECNQGCNANCSGKTCGDDDGCGGVCTGCPAGETCNAANWQCEGGACTPDCAGQGCGDDDGCGGRCLGCPAGQTCNQASWVCEGGDENLMPAAGIWHYDEFGYAQNTCNFEIVGNGDGGFRIQNVNDPLFTVVPGDGTDEFTCTVDGSDYTCDRLGLTEDLSGEGIAAVLSGDVHVAGAFSDDKHTSGSQTGSINCNGAGCAVLTATYGISFPCSIRVDYHGHWVVP